LATTRAEEDGNSKRGVESLVSYAPAPEARRDVGAEAGTLAERAVLLDCCSSVWSGALRGDGSDASVLGRGLETTFGCCSDDSRGADGDGSGDCDGAKVSGWTYGTGCNVAYKGMYRSVAKSSILIN